MKEHSVKEVSKLSGVTIRTLHHYDKIGLLKPLHRTEAGYRYYGAEELLRLQQILFYRELDFSLKEIQELLDDPAFDLIEALESHKSALRSRRKRISVLLATIDNTINDLKQGKEMSKPEKLYEGLPKEMGTTYREEAMDSYGKEAIARSEEALLKLNKEDFKSLRKSLENVNKELYSHRLETPEGEIVQLLIARHYEIIRAFWGTSDLSDKQAVAYAGLGDLYVQDERFTTIGGKPQPEFAAFLRDAMRHFADTQLQ